MIDLILVVAGVVLFSVGLGITIGTYIDRAGRDESRLDDEYEALRAAGYPMYPVWQARQNGGDRPEDEEPVA